ncbi:MAG: ABC transporter substrate-binding protein [Candidatus Rokubacteria bacterium]|nr:ABC transporter substrate-binding protein [Candidatus Rokubacteria bacterium]
MRLSTTALIITLARATLLVPLAVDAQQAGKVQQIGVLAAGSRTSVSPYLEGFQQGLRQLGYVERQNIAMEYRWAEGKFDRLPALAAELVQLGVDVILASTTPAARAAKEATKTIPIVMVGVADPVGSGLVAGLARPGGNLTGLSAQYGERFGEKWVELLKEAAPKVARMAVLWNPTNPAAPPIITAMRVAARAVGVALQTFEVRVADDFDVAFAKIVAERLGALIVVQDPLMTLNRTRILDFAAKNRLPAMYGLREYVLSGGLMSYGGDVVDQYRRAANYVDRILKAAKPADLPVEQPTKFELMINLKTAKSLGLTIPRSVLIRADTAIQ